MARRCLQVSWKKGVVVRPIDLYGMPDFLRVTIGTHQENVRFLAELKGLL